MKFRVYVEMIDARYHGIEEVEFIHLNWHDVMSIWFNDDGSVAHVVIKDGKDSVSTIFAEQAKIKLELDGKIIWEN